MSSHGGLPQELVDQVIDELANACLDPDRDKRSDHHIDAREALHACALVSKNWTGRSRAHLFREVNIKGDDDGLCLLPPPSLMPYVTNLKIQLRCQHYRLFPSRDLVTPFHTAPITHFGIEDGVLATEARVCLVECITALSAALQTVTFKSCSLSPRLINEIVFAHPGLGRLHLLSCDLEHIGPDRSTISLPWMRSKGPDLELRVVSELMWGVHDRNVTTVAQLPMQFGKLDFDHISGQFARGATNSLIKASAESLSSLTVHIISCTSRIPKRKDAANCCRNTR